MLVLLDTGQSLDTCEDELGYPVQQLLTPLTRYNLQRPNSRFAIDNGAFSRFDESSFLSLLRREFQRREQCLFVCAPDVVASARRTLEIFERWKPKLKDWKVALVMQDGQEDLSIPWDEIDAAFIGGSTGFKLSVEAGQIIKAAKILGKWVHVGRVNEYDRLKHFEELGADSCDGTGIARYTHMRHAIKDAGKQAVLVA